MKLLASTTLILLLSMTASNGWSQTTCEEPRRCFSKDEVRALVDAKCFKDRAKAERVDELTGDLSAAEEQVTHYKAEWGACQRQLDERPVHIPARRVPMWLRLALDVGIGATAGSTGAVAGLGGPSEVIVGLAVASVGTLIARIVVEFLDR